MQDVYQVCPEFEDESYLLRAVVENDCHDLLKVYSDEKAVLLFNSDNCHGDDFHYKTEKRMKQAMDFWSFSYEKKYFVRWAIVDKETGEVIGTIELFHRDAEDYFSNCGLLRLDLRSDYENANEIESIVSLIIEPAFDLFYCDNIATKVVPTASERRTALLKMGFAASQEKLVGHDGTEYDNYYVLHR